MIETSKLMEKIKIESKNILLNYKDFLDLSARLYHYDILNLILIHAQCPDAQSVAGYQAWRLYNRELIPSAKAIVVLIPTIEKSQNESAQIDENGDPICDENGIVKTEIEEISFLTYKPAYVFDINQTKIIDGENEVINIEHKFNLDSFPSVFRKKTKFSVSITSDESDIPKHKKYVLSKYDEELILKENLSTEESASCYLKAYTQLIADKKNEVFSDGRPMADLAANAASYIASKVFGLSTDYYNFSWATTLSNLPPKELINFFALVQDIAYNTIESFDSVLMSFNDVNIINCLLSTFDRQDYLSIMQDIKDNTVDKLLINTVDRLIVKIDGITDNQFLELYNTRNNQDLFTIPIKYFKEV